jgi:tetratricopeptide (TPR) repeat protein
MPSREVVEALIKATGDDFRLVRIQAAASLAGYLPRLPEGFMNEQQRKNVARATEEFIATHMTRPDQWTSHYNLGNYYLDLQKPEQALKQYETAIKLEPLAVLPLVNASMAHARLGHNDQAAALLNQALTIEPESAVAHFNLGLLMSEQNNPAAAEKHLRAALKADPQMHEAAFNLGVLITKTKPDEAITLCRRAYELNPSPQYAYSLAFYQYQGGRNDESAKVLLELIRKQPAYVDAYLMLGEIYEKQGRLEDARAVYQEALSQKGISRQDKSRFKFLLRQETQP